MSFLYPLGLLGLIAVPVLIIIYIIKNKYTEQVVSATYLWTLSEKFLKRKNPINRLTGIISLILQILAVVLISFAVAHPVFVLKDAALDYCFILDGSGSMNITRDDGTRFDAAKSEILSIIDGSKKGSSYTLVYASTDAEVVYEGITSKSVASERLSEITSDYCASTFSDAMNRAQEYFNENPSVKVYLVTDKEYESYSNIEVINVGTDVENYSLFDASWSYKDDGVEVRGLVVSYKSDANLSVSLYVDDSETAYTTQIVSVNRLEEKEFTFKCQITDFSSLRVAILNSDALALDNDCRLYNVKNDVTYRSLVVSERPFFIRGVLKALGNTQVDAVSPDDYRESGDYGLYIFDSYSPAEMPKDGAVWFVNPTNSTDNSGFTYQSPVSIPAGGALTYSTSSSTLVQSMLKDVVKAEEVYISSYVRCGLYKNFTTVMYYESDPVLFVGSNSYGNREAVIAFSLNESDFAVTAPFVAIFNNLLNYTFPEIVDNTYYYCGDSAAINVLANCDSIRVDSPLGTVSYLDTSGTSTELELTEAGTYTVTMLIGSTMRTVYLYSALPVSERVPEVREATALALTGTAGNDMRDGVYDDLLILFIILAVIYIADWMVYCYEQYQLR